MQGTHLVNGAPDPKELIGDEACEGGAIDSPQESMPPSDTVSNSRLEPGSAPATLAEMMRGVEPIDAIVNKMRRTPSRWAKLVMACMVVDAYRWVVRPVRGSPIRSAKSQRELKRRMGLRLRSRHPDPASLKGEHYLSLDEVEAFEREGLLGPFEVLPPAEALRVGRKLQELGRDDFRKNSYFSEDVILALEAAGDWNLNFSASFQALRVPMLWNLVKMPQIAQRMASLLGPDVICWRTQCFEKPPGAAGTFWHQNSVFREVSRGDKLVPPPGVDPGMVQLTAWIALTDSTEENGALRMIPGSFDDGRFEYFYSYALDHIIDVLSSLPRAELTQALKVYLFTSGAFERAQMLFNMTLSQIGVVFDGKPVRTLSMRAGECVIFSSLNMHCSFPNRTPDQTRLAFVGRYTSNDVRVFPGMRENRVMTPSGFKYYSLERTGGIQVHGSDTICLNRIIPEVQS